MRNLQARNELTSILFKESFMMAKVLPQISATVKSRKMGIDLCSLKFTFAYFSSSLAAQFLPRAQVLGLASLGSEARSPLLDGQLTPQMH